MHLDVVLDKDSVVKSEYWTFNYKKYSRQYFLNFLCSKEAENKIKCKQHI